MQTILKHYSKNYEFIVDKVRTNTGIRRSILVHEVKGNNKIVKRLENAGVIEVFGSPKQVRLGPNVDTVPQKKSTEKRARPAPMREAILSALGDEELGIGEIARRTGRTTSNISQILLEMTSRGLVVRRRQLGIPRGMANSREFYMYRRA